MRSLWSVHAPTSGGKRLLSTHCRHKGWRYFRRMSELTVVYAGREGADFSSYLYRVLRDDECVAEISHTYRGDEHFLRKPTGEWQSSDRLIEGGGPEPLRLSEPGARAVERLLAS